ncbi:hypothetical protein [Streptomyces adustus]|uniref:hypothetical protein n=1 Tax=Streptomyces adustus TaxID=1609272 RepID=UPI001EE4A39B|nr:hypothetical protein [Streptomyces adustus]
MPSMTATPTLTSRPPLPKRPLPHEKTPDRPGTSGARPHPQRDARVDAEIGPRTVGAIYQTSISAYEVLAVIRDPERASALLRRTALWAVIVRDIMRADAEPYAVGDTWTTSDRLVREGRTPAAYAPAA